MLHRFTAGVCVIAFTGALAAPALAFDCVAAKKPPTAGSAVLLDDSGGVTPLKNNPGTEEQIHGGFVAFTDGENTVSTFAHAPEGVLPPVREGGPQDNCDGKGLDSIEECF